MTEKTTYIKGGGAALILRGSVSYPDAVERFRVIYEAQRNEAERALAAVTAGDVRVWHQRGIWVAHDQHELTPTSEARSDDIG